MPDFLKRTAMALVMGLAAGVAQAQNFPSKPVTMIVPYPAGGVTDTIARLLGEKMQPVLGQTVIVENVGGGSGSIGVGRVARAAPDGYTFLLGNAETNIINGVNIKLNYDVIEDFVPVIRLPAYAFIIVSKNAVPAKSLNDLIGWLKGAGGKPFQGMVGTGTAQHLCGLSFQSTIGAQWGFVPYRGGGPAMQDLIAGQFDIMCTATGSFLPLVRAGQIRAYAVTAPRRLESAQDIPTVDEAGMPGFYWAVWNALWAPKGTPAAAIEKLNAAALAGQRDPAFRKRMIELGLDLPPDDQLTPAALGAFHRAEAKRWIPLAQRVKALPPPAAKPEAKP